MYYAHVTNGVIDSMGQPPEKAFVNGRWLDLRNRDAETLLQAGWYPVIESTRPVDTPTGTSTPIYVVAGTVVNQTWASIPKTAEQIATEQLQITSNTIRQLLDETLPVLETITNTTNANLIGNTLAAAVKDIARGVRRLIRLEINKLDGTN